MALGLVARSAVAISDSINSIYRVLKGSDPDSLALRLPSGGSFEVRHSGTNAPVFRVTDAGMVGSITGDNIADGTITSAELGPDSVTSDNIADGSIVNADVSPSAGIIPSKIHGGGTPDRVLGTTDGTVLGPVLVSSAMLADGAITNVDVNAAAAIAYSKLNLAGSVTSADLVDGTIVNADVNAAAAIAVTKVAHVGANNVLRSNGTANVGGPVVTNDMVVNTINGDRLEDLSIPSSKLITGAPISPGSIGMPELSSAAQMVLSADNPIQNGGFAVWQRGTSFAAAVDGQYTADRWMYQRTASAVVHTISQGGSPPIAATVPGATASLLLTVTTPDAAIAAGDLVGVAHRIEGATWISYAQKSFTVGFWAYSSVAGIHCISARNASQNRSCVLEYTISTPSTWEYKTVTFPASGVVSVANGWNVTNGVGVTLTWALAAGSASCTDISTVGTWVAANAVATMSGGVPRQVNDVGTGGNVFLLWGVTLAAGATVPPFWPRPYGEELALCTRYCQVISSQGLNYASMTNGEAANGTNGYCTLPYSPKRGLPSLTVSGSASWAVSAAGGLIAASGLSVSTPTLDAARLDVVVAGGLVGGQALRLVSNSTSLAQITITAEL